MLIEIKDVFKSFNYNISDDAYQHALRFFSEERKSVREKIELLSWNETVEGQNMAIKELAVELLPCEYIYLVMPDRYVISEKGSGVTFYKQGTGKAKWENAAKTIIKLGWPKVDHIVVPLFMWLLDPNWPGSILIYEFIMSLPSDIFLSKIGEILNNPQNYTVSDYSDLSELIEEMQRDKGIV